MAVKLIPESIREVLEYRPDTGDLIWIKARHKSRVGKVAGSTNSDGYRYIQWQRRIYYAHRVAYFLMTGEQPPAHIDHKHHDRADNRWSEIRPSDHTRNKLNLAKSKSKILGVHWNKKTKKWYARLTINKALHQLYYGPDFFEACCARKSAENRLHQPLL